MAIGIPNSILSTGLSSNSFAFFIAESLFKVIKALYSLFSSIILKASLTKYMGFISLDFNFSFISFSV